MSLYVRLIRAGRLPALERDLNRATRDRLALVMGELAKELMEWKEPNR